MFRSLRRDFPLSPLLLLLMPFFVVAAVAVAVAMAAARLHKMQFQYLTSPSLSLCFVSFLFARRRQRRQLRSVLKMIAQAAKKPIALLLATLFVSQRANAESDAPTFIVADSFQCLLCFVCYARCQSFNCFSVLFSVILLFLLPGRHFYTRACSLSNTCALLFFFRFQVFAVCSYALVVVVVAVVSVCGHMK